MLIRNEAKLCRDDGRCERIERNPNTRAFFSGKFRDAVATRNVTKTKNLPEYREGLHENRLHLRIKHIRHPNG
jgi:hypothetical protein